MIEFSILEENNKFKKRIMQKIFSFIQWVGFLLLLQYNYKINEKMIEKKNFLSKWHGIKFSLSLQFFFFFSE